MKYDLIVRYAGQEVVFKDLELDDEVVCDESYTPGRRYAVESNNERIIENFTDNFMCEVHRHAST